MTDERPRPKYGEYADVPPAAPPIPAVTPAEPVEPGHGPALTRPRRTWDLVLSTALLLWGVFDVVTGFPAYARLGATVSAAAEQQGFEGFASVELADEVGAWLNVARVVILVIAILGTLWRLARGRLAFWVPLAGGALAVVVVIVSVFVILIGDPGFTAFVSGQTTP